MLRGIFISGTGTDVGKTLVTAALARALWSISSPCLAIKAIQTGTIKHNEAPPFAYGDSALYAKALASWSVAPSLQPRTLHHFALAASPHLAAQEEHMHMSVQQLLAEITACSAQANNAPLLIEGAGGVYVPLNHCETSLDLMQALDLPVLVVMENGLGALNHTLLTLEVLQKRKLSIAALVCTQKTPDNDLKEALIRRDNIDFLQNYCERIPLYTLPYIEHAQDFCAEENIQALETAAQTLKPLAQKFLHTYFHEHLCPAPSKNEDIAAWDKTHLWHPYTSAIDPLPVHEVSHAKGMHIYLRHKKEPLIDGMSSWWCAVHGYGQKDLLQAAQKQIHKMPHIMFGGLTHKPAVAAGKILLHLLHKNCAPLQALQKIFWADSGSVAVEVALKMALQYQQGRGQSQRTLFLSPRGGYYGDTLGAMSVCDPVNGMHKLFNKVLPKHIFIPRPACAFTGDISAPFDPACLTPLEEAFATHGKHLAAFIVEPIVQGAGGMWFYDPRYLRKVKELCLAHDVLLIFDEIATGFGRTGKLFAAEWAAVAPDICCVGKALTGGVLSLAASICTEDVAQGICAHDQVFMHGPTFMGNALACAVAHASLNIFAKNMWQEQVASIEKALRHGLAPCINLEGVAHVRVLGAIGVVEMEKPVNVAALQAFFIEKNVWIRPFSRLIYVMPPYVATPSHCKQLTSAIYTAIQCGVHTQ